MTNENAWPPKMAVCVGTVVLKDDKVLLIRQAKGTSLEGRWSIPCPQRPSAPGEAPYLQTPSTAQAEVLRPTAQREPKTSNDT